ncbi:MAG: septal ring lytic transglycosylase RlpA family protein [Candidatus Atribacteria bacterium]|nr:septal ring lytic transglycosylase RlpA family protein [Candidatus Atribacteria bacterium]
MLDLALLWLNQIQMEFYRLYDGYEGRVVNRIIGLASWYGPRFIGKTTACEETFNPYAFTAAHRTLPIGSILLVSNPENGKKVVVRVNDRGPRSKNREIDLSLAAAKAIGIQQAGVDEVTIEVIE